MGLLVWSTLLLLVGRATPEWSVVDGKTRAIHCFEEMAQDGDITNLLLDVTTSEKIDAFCSQHAELMKCIRKNEHHLSVEEDSKYQKKIFGVHNFYINVCPPGTDITADYKRKAPCFKLIKNKILSCGSDLPDLNSYKMKNDLRSRCCALHTHNECLMSATEEHCGIEATRVLEKVLERYFQIRSVCGPSSHNCDVNEHTTPRSKHKWTIEYLYPGTVKKERKASTASSHWEKDEHHSGKMAVTVNTAITLLGCFAAIYKVLNLNA